MILFIDLFDIPAAQTSTQELSAGTFTALATGLFVGHPPVTRGMAPCCYLWNALSPKILVSKILLPTACIYCVHTHVSHYGQKSIDWYMLLYHTATLQLKMSSAKNHQDQNCRCIFLCFCYLVLSLFFSCCLNWEENCAPLLDCACLSVWENCAPLLDAGILVAGGTPWFRNNLARAWRSWSICPLGYL